MNRLVVWIEMIGGLAVWCVVTAVLFFYLSFAGHYPGAPGPSLWPRIFLVVSSAATYALFVRKVLRKLDH